MEPKKASNSLALRKVAALRKGGLRGEDFTMLSFLVGSEDSDAQEICACKFDLVVASEYFQGLLRSPLTLAEGPIRIKHVEPEIFMLVVEFTHTCGNLVTEVNDLEQWLKLAAVADEFLLQELGQLCTEKLEEMITLDNVWTVFSQNHLIKYTSAVCEKLLSSLTDECLEEPAFLKINENALAKFLSFEKMNINSEMELVLACFKFIKGKEDERALFRRCALPHLRLLTLTEADLEDMLPYLNSREKFYLAIQRSPLIDKNDLATLKIDENLSLSTIERNAAFTQIDKIEKRVFKFVDMEKEDYKSKGREFYNLCNTHTFTLTLHAKRAILVTGFDIFQLISQDLSLDASVRFQTNCTCGGTYSNGEVLSKSLTDSGIHFETKTCVPRGGIIKLKIQIADQRFDLRSISAEQCVANAFNLNDALARLIFKKIDIDHSESNSYSLRCPRVNIFKSIDYMLE